MVRAKPHRLERLQYVGEKSVVFTSVVAGRYPVFTQSEIVTELAQILDEARIRNNCLVIAYAFMPDHLHAFVRGVDDSSNLLATFERFKQRSGYFLTQRNLPSWQPSFFDHIVRNGDDWREQIRYILRNPVRAGLVEDWNDWPHHGSLGVEFYDVVSDL